MNASSDNTMDEMPMHRNIADTSQTVPARNPFEPRIPQPRPTRKVEEEKEPAVSTSLDVDELVKKIDAKIAELEKEEQEEKNKAKGVSSYKPIVESKEEKPDIKESVPSNDKVTINKPITNELVIEDEEDDDFFDDFFDN